MRNHENVIEANLDSSAVPRYRGFSTKGEAIMSKLKGRILTASEVRKLVRKTIWVLTYEGKNGRDHFLGSYPSHEEAEQAGREEFPQHKQTDVMGYDPRLLLR
jgi:hypothetical protein